MPLKFFLIPLTFFGLDIQAILLFVTVVSFSLHHHFWLVVFAAAYFAAIPAVGATIVILVIILVVCMVRRRKKSDSAAKKSNNLEQQTGKKNIIYDNLNQCDFTSIFAVNFKCSDHIMSKSKQKNISHICEFKMVVNCYTKLFR